MCYNGNILLLPISYEPTYYYHYIKIRGGYLKSFLSSFLGMHEIFICFKAPLVEMNYDEIRIHLRRTEF